MKKILILAANPRGDLRLDREIRDLKKAIERDKNSEQFAIEIELAVRPKDLQELLYDHQPYIVHFCGHGTGEQGLVFESENQEFQLVSNQALSNLLRIFQENIECVVLNACHTETQADVVVEHIPYAIGTSREIQDKAAYWFTVGFYKALVREQSIETSYDWGCNAVQLNMPHVNLVIESTGQFRKLSTIEEDNPDNATEPLRIVLKQKIIQNELSQPLNPETQQPEANLEQAASIPVDFREEIVQEVKIQNYKNSTRKTLDELGQNSLVETETISKIEYRQRQTLLNKVKEFWIDGFLKPSLYANNAINLELKSRPDAILRPFISAEVLPIELDESFEELQQTDIYQQIGEGKTLLILGEPGSGKTITLLQLAEHLIAQTEKDLTKPIPIVFNLASWGQKQQAIEQWLIEEFKDKYQVPQIWSEKWLKQQQLILLLDGLDEVREKQRNACVRAINKFIADHNITEMVVCSRVQDYEALTERLQLSSALCIKPLSTEQVYGFLDRVGDSLLGLRNLLQQNADLEKFAQTPLILNIMSLVYQDWSTEDLLQQLQSRENRYQHLFDSYIERMLSRRVSNQKKQKYPKKKVFHWLSWLAQQMVRESMIIFLIEKLQPSLLNAQDKKKYRITNLLTGGLILGLIGWLLLGQLGCLIGGLVGFRIFHSSMEIILFEQISWSWFNMKSKFIREVVLGICVGLIGGTIVGVSSWLHLGAIFETSGSISDLIFLLIKWVIRGLKIGFFWGFIIGLNIDFNFIEVQQKMLPNQGIWSSSKNSVKIGLIEGIIWALRIGLIFLLIGLRIEGFKKGMITGVICGLFFGLKNGGITCIQHFNLRRILCRQGHMPWDYARFLDYASELLLMKKVGGGYVFYHRMLMEHFAQM